MTGALVVVATPIGNLEDLSPRAARELREADLVACEDTRRTASLLRAAAADVPMMPAHAHNEAARAEDIVRRIGAGKRVVLVSDAGMPGVSDPGGRVVRAAREAGLPVQVVPGPSAVETALVASGLAPVGGGFRFHGFVPRRAGDRMRLIDAVLADSVPSVVFESPKRLPSLLADLAGKQPGRSAAVCRELTKVHEEVVVDSVAALAERFSSAPRGEVTVVIAAAEAPQAPGEAELVERMGALVDSGLSPSQAAQAAAALGVAPRNAAYSAALVAAESRSSK